VPPSHTAARIDSVHLRTTAVLWFVCVVCFSRFARCCVLFCGGALCVVARSFPVLTGRARANTMGVGQIDWWGVVVRAVDGENEIAVPLVRGVPVLILFGTAMFDAEWSVAFTVEVGVPENASQ